MLEINTIHFVDCIKGMQCIDDNSVDMVFTDLPYGTTRNAWDNIIPLDKMWTEVERIIKPRGNILFFCQGMFTAKLMLSNEKLHRYNIVWNKVLPSGFLNANKQPLRTHEDIAVFYKEFGTYNPQMRKGDKCHSKGNAVGHYNSEVANNANYGDYRVVETHGDLKYPESIWTFSKPHPSTAIHPTQKPIDLCRYAVRTFSNPDDLVVDFCCGSGSIPLAAALEGRRYIGIDNGICYQSNSKYHNKSWADIASERIHTAIHHGVDIFESATTHKMTNTTNSKKLF